MMENTFNVAMFVGSLRRASISAALAKALTTVAPVHLELEAVGIRDLPHYDPDLEGTVPEWTALRERIREADAVMFITPEYNRSIPGALKNAIDVGSRPYGGNAWAGKPALVISLSQGTMGGFGAAHHLRQALVCLDVAAMPAPEVYLAFADRLLDSTGQFSNEVSKTFLATVLVQFALWIERNRVDRTRSVHPEDTGALVA